MRAMAVGVPHVAGRPTLGAATPSVQLAATGPQEAEAVDVVHKACGSGAKAVP